MLRFIKHHMNTMEGVEIYPIISLLLFFIVFTTMLIIVLRIPKKSIEEIGNLPLDNDLKDNSHEQQ